ncbi:MAG: molybdopterin-synthase adenylyltransferase [Candidatus Diapherotrites archaeon]|nr:molybdopterin-synthase adenylyltransferase [Candidatus Diapherotrites archaeon]
MRDRYLRQRAAVDQEALSRSRVLVAGAGGLGNFVATELALAGVGEIVIVDPDTVEIHNLNRQFLYREEDIGKYKAEIAEERLKEINPHVSVKGFVGRWQDLDLNGYDLVFDCLDTWEEKRGLMRSVNGVLVSGSVGEDVGFVSVLVKGEIPAESIRGTCTQRVLGARVGVIGSIMANEGIRELSGEKSPLRDRILYVEFRRMEFHILDLPP